MRHRALPPSGQVLHARGRLHLRHARSGGEARARGLREGVPGVPDRRGQPPVQQERPQHEGGQGRPQAVRHGQAPALDLHPLRSVHGRDQHEADERPRGLPHRLRSRSTDMGIQAEGVLQALREEQVPLLEDMVDAAVLGGLRAPLAEAVRRLREIQAEIEQEVQDELHREAQGGRRRCW